MWASRGAGRVVRGVARKAVLSNGAQRAALVRGWLPAETASTLSIAPRFGVRSFTDAVSASEGTTDFEGQDSNRKRFIPLEQRKEVIELAKTDFPGAMEKLAAYIEEGYAIASATMLVFARRVFTSDATAEEKLERIKELNTRAKDWNIGDPLIFTPSLIRAELGAGNDAKAKQLYEEAKGSISLEDRRRATKVLRVENPFIAQYAINGDVEGFRKWLDTTHPATDKELAESLRVKEFSEARRAALAKNEKFEPTEEQKLTPTEPGVLRPRYLAVRQFGNMLLTNDHVDKTAEFIKALMEDHTWTARVNPQNMLLKFLKEANEKAFDNALKLSEKLGYEREVTVLPSHIYNALRNCLLPTPGSRANVTQALQICKMLQKHDLHVPMKVFVEFTQQAFQDDAVPRFSYLLYQLDDHGVMPAAWRTFFNQVLRNLDENTARLVPSIWRAFLRRTTGNAATRAILINKDQRFGFSQSPDVPPSLMTFIGASASNWTQQAGFSPFQSQQPDPYAQQQQQWGAPQQPWGQPPQQQPQPWGQPQQPQQPWDQQNQQQQWGPPAQPQQPWDQQQQQQGWGQPQQDQQQGWGQPQQPQQSW